MQLKEALVGTIRAIALTLEKRDPYTAGHQARVAELATAIAGELGLQPQRIEGIRLGATIHDIGKTYVPSEILDRPGRLTAAEFELVKSHAQVGYDIVKDIHFPWPVAQMILQHHERPDGSGYPQGLKGDAICLEARILAVADVVGPLAHIDRIGPPWGSTWPGRNLRRAAARNTTRRLSMRAYGPFGKRGFVGASRRRSSP